MEHDTELDPNSCDTDTQDYSEIPSAPVAEITRPSEFA
jgi:hypothetical protein